MNASEYLSAGLNALPNKSSRFASRIREVTYHSKRHWQWVAETPVRLTRAAKPSQKKGKKLLKSAGHHLESWQQESALAIAKRLLVASMACVTVWAMAADKSAQAAELRAFLIKLSERQMRQKVEFTNPALLAGWWVFLSLLKSMEAYSQEELDRLKQNA